MGAVLMAVVGEEGHRRDSIRLFNDLFTAAGLRAEVGPLRLRHLFASEVLFSPMLEDHAVAFALVSAIRAMLGRTSVTLAFRPRETSHSPRLKHRVKLAVLRFLKRLGRVHVLTILPFSVDPKFADWARDWIYDPQLWDAFAPAYGGLSDLAAEVETRAAGRRVAAALGDQNSDKGFDFFSRLWESSPALREEWLFVAAGKVGPGSAVAGEAFSGRGGLLSDRFASDGELLDLYRMSHLIWACYDPVYDQASGIFGRAVQFGTPTVIRQGSYLEGLASEIGHPAVSIAWNDPASAAHVMAAAPPRSPPAEVEDRLARMRAASVATLGERLGLDLTARRAV